MKEKLLNGLMILVVLFCLGITLSNYTPKTEPVLSMENTFASVIPTPSPHPLDACRKERDAQRQEALSSLTWLSQDAASGLQNEAQTALLSLQSAAQIETAAENLLTAMGYQNNVCILQKEGMLLFTEPAVKQEDAMLIIQSAADISGLPPEKIRLMVP